MVRRGQISIQQRWKNADIVNTYYYDLQYLCIQTKNNRLLERHGRHSPEVNRRFGQIFGCQVSRWKQLCRNKSLRQGSASGPWPQNPEPELSAAPNDPLSISSHSVSTLVALQHIYRMILSLSPCSASIFPFFPIFSVFCFPVCFMLYPRSDTCRTSKDPYRLSRKSMRHRRGTGAVSAIRVPEPRTISDHLVDFCQNHGDDYLTTLGFLQIRSLCMRICVFVTFCHSLRSAQETLHTLPVSRSMASQWAPGAFANVWRWSDEWNYTFLIVFMFFAPPGVRSPSKMQSSKGAELSTDPNIMARQIMTNLNLHSLPPFFLGTIQFSGVGSWCALVAALRKNYSHVFFVPFCKS